MRSRWTKRKVLKKIPAKLQPLIEIASMRPVDLATLQSAVRVAGPIEETASGLTSAIEVLLAHDGCRSDAANLFVAALRSFLETDMAAGFEFGRGILPQLPDPRAVRSLIAFHARAGNVRQAMGFLQLAEDSKWAREMTQKLEAKLHTDVHSSADPMLTYFGYRSLIKDPRPAVLLYGDINMNLVDGSSVWMASTAEALSGLGLDVHLLLREPTERPLLLEPLFAQKDIEILEPTTFGHATLKGEAAPTVISELDGIIGGYRAVIIRGTQLCTKLVGNKHLHKRIWPYLTDFYEAVPSSGEPAVSPTMKSVFSDLRHLCAGFLVQTPAMLDVMRKQLGVPAESLHLLPPLLPDALVAQHKDRPSGPARTPKDCIRLGYLGKLAPQWGLLELFECAESLRGDGHRVEVHVFGDKFHEPVQADGFRERVTDLLSSESTHWHGALPRAKALDQLRQMDLAWCYRAVELEQGTLELSTKLLEILALGLPMVVTRNAINEALLGADYPLFVDHPSELTPLVKSFAEGAVSVDVTAEPFQSKLAQHTFSKVRDEVLRPAFDTAVLRQPKRIVLAGHDLKFVGELESHFKQLGHIVKRDYWEWGEPSDITRSRYLVKWADHVWCEWGLAHAVWYSKNLDPHKRLVVRIHQQEVVKKARRFPPQFQMQNIDAMVFVAKHIREKAMRDFGWGPERLHDVPNFLNTEIFNRPKRQEARHTIGIIGVVPSEHKRLDRALDLMMELRKEDPRFNLVIKGNLPKDMPWMKNRTDEIKFFDRQFARIEQSPLQGGVQFSEFTPRLSEWYQSIGCVISPSNFESFHYSIAEGGSSGALPVVWPWEGARDTYPDSWIVNDVAEAKERILAHMGSRFDAFGAQAEDNKAFLKEHYGLKNVLATLTGTLLPD